MTKKHFRQFAQAIDAQRRVTFSDKERQDDRLQTLRDVAEQFATIASQDNPRFDRDRFMKECGLGTTYRTWV